MILDKNVFDIWSSITRSVFRAKFSRPKYNKAIKAIRETLEETGVTLYVHIPFCTGICIFCPYVLIPIPKFRKE